MKAVFLLSLLFTTYSVMAQTTESPFFSTYETYRQEGLEKRRFRHRDILPLLQNVQAVPGFTVSKAGASVEGRDIYLLKVGKGKTKVLLWSQMHGDEPTATMALFDIFSFFSQQGDHMDSIRQLLLNELSIYFIPMLNPDGAEVYQRRNALGIDLNRDALRLSSPEAQILKSVRDRIEPEWGFNLHDMNILYSAGKSPKPATIAFLAPPYDEEKNINEGRRKAMQLIVVLNEVLQAYIPGQVGKWSDEFEPRAFGDNIQKWGTSTVLIESGGYKGDPEKQFIRKLNYVIIMQGLLSIARETYSNQDLEPYNQIPENERQLFSLLIRNARIEQEGERYQMDFGINRSEENLEDRQEFYVKSEIEDMGDLSVYYGYEELDAGGMLAVPGKVYPRSFKNVEELRKADIHQLIKSGYTAVKLRNLPKDNFTRFPINIIQEGTSFEQIIAPDARANFLLQKDDEVQYAVINGFLYHVPSKEHEVPNALVIEK